MSQVSFLHLSKDGRRGPPSAGTRVKLKHPGYNRSAIFCFGGIIYLQKHLSYRRDVFPFPELVFSGAMALEFPLT